MAKRTGLARTQALIENLKRELSLGGATLAGVKDKVSTVTGAGGSTSLTVADSDTTYVINTGGGTHTFLLPTPAAGLRFKFFIATTDSTDVVVRCTSDGASAANIGFGLFTVNGDAVSVATAADDLTFGVASNNHTIGDWVEGVCDGTNWWFTGAAVVAASLNIV